jgi:penicillin-binding protein 1A
VPIFIDFMRDALQNQPPEDFKAPPGAKLISVHGNVEAFRPGTEPKPEAVAAPIPGLGGPIPPPGAPLPLPAAPPPPPPPKKAPADLKGLY